MERSNISTAEKKLEEAYELILNNLPLKEEGVERTPQRAAKALVQLCSGYFLTPQEVIGQGIFPYSGEGIVHVRDIQVCSLCEHHILPFIGTCSIA